jgi:hypothetical protein
MRATRPAPCGSDGVEEIEAKAFEDLPGP